MIDTSKWDDRISIINDELDKISKSNDSVGVKAKRLLEIDQSLQTLLSDFDTSNKFPTIEVWEDWINEYNRLSSVIDNITKELSYITSDLIDSEIDEDSALKLISKLMEVNGYENIDGSFIKGDSKIIISDSITDDYIDYLTEQIRG